MNQSERGAYRSLAGGDLPLRRTEEAIQRLSLKAADRAKRLDAATSKLKRREVTIKTLEEHLSLSNKMLLQQSDEIEELQLKIDALEAKSKDLEDKAEQIAQENIVLQSIGSQLGKDNDSFELKKNIFRILRQY